MNPPILFISRDLIFTTKVTGTATALNVSVATKGTLGDALASAGPETRLAIVDLASLLEATAEELRAFREQLPESARLMAFGSHVDVDRLREARAAGCDPVLARSEFSSRLSQIILDAAAAN